jgi:hypothetical protein
MLVPSLPCRRSQKILNSGPFDDASAIYLFTLEKRHRDLLRKIQGPTTRGGKGKGRGKEKDKDEELRGS